MFSVVLGLLRGKFTHSGRIFNCINFLWLPLQITTDLVAQSTEMYCFIYSSGGQESEIKVSTWLTPSGGSEGKSVPCLFSPSFCWLPPILGLLWLVGASLQSPSSSSHDVSPVCLCPNCPLLIGIPVIGLEPTLIQKTSS